MIALGKETVSYTKLSEEVDFPKLLHDCCGITRIPCLICSPLREDKKPSFKLYSPDGKVIYFKDFSTGEHGGMLKFFSLLWNVDIQEVVKIINEKIDMKPKPKAKMVKNVEIDCTLESSTKKIEVKVRDWKKHDVDYWGSYGIDIETLKKASVYPVSHRIMQNPKTGKNQYIRMDKLAYAYVERKEKNVSIKLYQPFNTKGFKWLGNHKGDVISLWNTLPESGNICCLCSSVKDALCLRCTTGIPAICLQGEGYKMSDTAKKNLKNRFKNIYVIYDNDKAGLKLGEKISQQTGFINLVLPKFEGGKDISDMYKSLGKTQLKKTIKYLLDNNQKNN